MRTTREHKDRRGGLAIVASALGLALLVAGVATGARSLGDSGATVAPESQVQHVEEQPEALAPTLSPRPQQKSSSPSASAEPERSKPRAQRHPDAGVPTRVAVPRLGIDVPVVGIDAPDGVLTPPDDPQVLGWWRSGARPGARTGSSLITGHTVSSGGGALDDLETLGRGNRATVRTPQGAVRYEVTGVQIYRKAALADHAQRVFSQQVPGRLVLITCEDWNGTTYESNVVVTASPVS